MGFLALLISCLALASTGFGLQWESSYSPKSVRLGGSITLQWKYTLTKSEQREAKNFAVVLIEKENGIYSNKWQSLAVKIPFNSELYKKVSSSSSIDFIQGEGVGVILHNATSQIITRYRCTFLSGFSAPKQLITPNIKVSAVNVRLVGGFSPNRGRVEIFHNGEWGTVCHNRWDIRDAGVVCRMLGYPRASKAYLWSYFGSGNGKIWLDYVDCNGAESSITECRHNPWGLTSCNHNEEAGVVCQEPLTTRRWNRYTTTTPATTRWTRYTTHTSGYNPVRLAGTKSSSMGRVEIYHNGEWGTICDDRWDINDARVVCRMLGYPSAYKAVGSAYFGRGSGRIWLDEVNCNGYESSLSYCRHSLWGRHDCTHYEDAGVMCTGTTTTMIPTIYTTAGANAVRLVGDSLSSSGRVEIYHSGEWGTICDDRWDINDARVVCRMLGYPSAYKAVGSAYFGRGSGRIWLDEVNCNGYESSLSYCRHSLWGRHDCSHSEDAGVVCAKADFNKGVCTFEQDLCGWKNKNAISYRWRRYSRSTPSLGTGPSGDHTTGAGFYIYTEATGISAGDVAQLISPLLQHNSSCLVFYYYMYGATVDKLNVKVGHETLWTMKGDQGRKWYRATVPLNISHDHVIIEGVRGATYQSDIAIDDLQILNNTKCNMSAESAVSPTISFLTSTKYVKRQGRTTIVCSAAARPSPTVKWIRNNKIVATGINSTRFTIERIQFDQSGIYSCVASNKFGSVKGTTLIYVLQSPMNTAVVFNASHSSAMIGEFVMVTCKTDAYPSATCEVYRHYNTLGKPVYIVPGITSSDFGVYNCSCSNNLGRGHGMGTLTLYEKPKIQTLFPRTQNINETDSFEIFCNASGNPLPNISWYMPGKDKPQGMGKSLLILNSSLDDEGTYICKADNGRYQATANATVNLLYRVPRIVNPPGNVSLVEEVDKHFDLYCNTTGNPKPKVTWFKVGSGIAIGQGENLRVQAKWNYSGIYECVAENGIGKSARARGFYQILHKPYATRLRSNRVNNVVIGNSPINITCSTNADPPADRYDIYLGNKFLITSTTGLYSIIKAKASDHGTYLCSPINTYGGGANASMFLHVIGALSIDFTPKNKTIIEGETIDLYCNASSSLNGRNFPAVIRWRKIGKEEKRLPDGELLVLEDIQPKEAGVYECVARNGIALPDVARATIVVHYKPRRTKLMLLNGKTYIFPKAAISMTCKTFAVPAATKFEFFHKGARIGQSSDGVFNISQVSASGNGTYSCIAENSIGKGSPALLTLRFAECGISYYGNHAQPQIVGGSTSVHGAWPWQVQMGATRSGKVYPHICGGSIINDLWIVTAAHCVTIRLYPGYLVVKPETLNITLGKQFLDRVDSTEQNIPVEQVIVNKNYSASKLDYDIALLKLQRPIAFNRYVSPVCLPAFDFPVGTTCFVSGWGRTGLYDPAANALKEAPMPLMSRTTCNSYYSSYTVTTRMRCAGTYGVHKGTCKGDSGGPLVCNKYGRWYLMGATSWGKRGCADSGYPGVYADILFFKTWIKSITGIID